jgi:hypothetical protein
MIETIIKDETAVEKETTKYPYIGKWNSDNFKVIVLFVKETTGVCIDSDYPRNYIGEYCNDWQEKYFNKFESEITLRNI